MKRAVQQFFDFNRELAGAEYQISWYSRHRKYYLTMVLILLVAHVLNSFFNYDFLKSSGFDELLIIIIYFIILVAMLLYLCLTSKCFRYI